MKFFKNKYSVAVLLITVFGALIRGYQLGRIPTSLNVDEVSIGYNAYSILKTGADEYGVRFPLTFKSLGDYKPPLYIYLTSVSEYVFGLNEFAVRFPSFIFGVFLIPLVYFLITEISKSEKTAFFASLLLSVSPWGIWFSRVASEAMVALFLLTLGLLFFLKSKGKLLPILISSVFFSLSGYTYHAEKIFVPLFAVFLAYIFRNRYGKKEIFLFLISILVLSLPVYYEMLFGLGATRAKMTSIIYDQDFQRNVAVNYIGGKYLFLFFYWIRKYLAYFSPSFLFYQSLNLTEIFSGLGVLNFFEVPLLVSGVYALFKKRNNNTWLVIAWVLLGVLPASLTMNEQHPIRAMIILSPSVYISALGLNHLTGFRILRKKAIVLPFLGFVVWNLTYSFLIFMVHNDYGRGENFMKGTKETVQYVLANQDKYKEIVFDARRGIKAPDLINVPHLYLLFYSAYEPLKYQTTAKREGGGIFGFDKYTVRNIDWGKDMNKKDTLFIGSQWYLPAEETKNVAILKKVYIGHDDLALIIATPK